MKIDVDEKYIKSLIKEVLHKEVLESLIKSACDEMKELKYNSWKDLQECSDLTRLIVDGARHRILKEYEKDYNFMERLADRVAESITDDELKNIVMSMLLKQKG